MHEENLRRKIEHIINGKDAWVQSDFDELFREYKRTQDKTLRDKLINSAYHLVLGMSKKYFSFGSRLSLDPWDIVQYGNIGLIECFDDHYDSERPGRNFNSYAVSHIKKSIVRNLEDIGRAIRIPNHQLAKLKRIADSRDEYLEQNDGLEPSVEDLAKTSYVSREEITMLLQILEPLSLEASLSEDSYSIKDFVSDPHSADRTNKTSEQDSIEYILRKANLTIFETRLVREKFGFDIGHGRTLEELGEKYGVTGERVRQRLTKIIRKVRIGNGLINNGKVKLPYEQRD